MAKAFIRGGYWHIRWCEDGKYYQKSTFCPVEGTSYPPRVDRQLAELKERLLCRKRGEEYVCQLPIREAFEEWSKEDKKLVAEGTWKFRQAFIPRFLEGYLDVMVGHFKEADAMTIIGKLNEHPMAKQTKKTIFGNLASFWDWCVKKGYARSQFFNRILKKKIKGDTEPRLERRAFTLEEEEKLIEALREEKKKWPLTCAMVGLWTGARISEAIQIQKQNLHFDVKELEGRITPYIKVVDIKRGGVIMEKVMHPNLEAFLKDLPDDAFPPQNANKVQLAYFFQKAAIKAGVPNATFHWLRHTLASRLFEEGVEERLAAAIIGHSSAVHREYAHASKKRLHEKLSLVSGVRKLSKIEPKLLEVSNASYTQSNASEELSSEPERVTTT